MPDLKQTLESSVITWLAASSTHSQTLGLAAVHDIADDQLTLPALVVTATVGAESIHGTGVYECTVEVAYRWQADDTTDANASTFWAKVKSVLTWDVLAARLSDASNLTVWGVVWDGSETHEINDRNHAQRFTLRCIAQPS